MHFEISNNEELMETHSNLSNNKKTNYKKKNQWTDCGDLISALTFHLIFALFYGIYLHLE